jgi:hypothetical protein
MDTLPCEFYWKLWFVISDDLPMMCQEALITEHMGEHVNVDLMIDEVNPKGTKRDMLAGWRLITFLNFSARYEVEPQPIEILL